MESIKILTLVGGISKKSLNQSFFNGIKNLDIHEFEFEQFDISKLPFYSQDIEMDPPDIVTQYKDKIRNADGFLFVTPEYNRSFPGVLKNAIDWGSRPYGQNLWDARPAAILGASPGNIGTFGAQHHLRQVLSYLNMYTMGQPELYFKATNAFDEQGKLANEKSIEIIKQFFYAFHEHFLLVRHPKTLTKESKKDHQSSLSLSH